MKKEAFTMLETIIVLILSVVIITFSFPNLMRSRQVVAEHEFWNDFRQSWQAAQVRSKTKHIETMVTFDPVSYQIEFDWRDQQKLVKGKLDIPETILVRKFDDFKMHENGYTKPRTQEFQSSINGRRYLMRIQLAWGGYRIEENKHHAFILADSLIALTIISLGITFTLICHQCLVRQTKQQYINLAAHRIAKEATDELVATQRPVYLRRDELNAIASEKKVVVSLDDQIILEVRK